MNATNLQLTKKAERYLAGYSYDAHTFGPPEA